MFDQNHLLINIFNLINIALLIKTLENVKKNTEILNLS